jgi:hypothetical protein
MFPRAAPRPRVNAGLTAKARRSVIHGMTSATRLRLGCACLGAAVAVAQAHPSRAQAPEEMAQALFTEGRLALERGDYATACPKFDASLKIVRRPGTLSNVAMCLEREGKLVSAMKHWKEAIDAMPPNDDRLPAARDRAAALSRKLPRLSVEVPREAGLVVRIDAIDFDAAAVPSELPLDPGDHVITVSGPDREPRSLQVKLAEGERRSVAIAPAPRRAAPALAATTPGMSTMRIAGLVTFGVGIVGAGVAVGTGAALLAKDGTIQRECPRQLCTPEGRAAIESTPPLFVANGVAWGVAAAGLGAGAALFFLGGRSVEKRVGFAVHASPAGAAFQGSF